MVLILILIMLVAGVLGGIVNIALRAEENTKKTWLMNIVAGIGASMLIPLFLRTLSSNLLSNILDEKPKPDDLLVFGGFCLLAAISSRTFIQTLSDKILKEAREARRQADFATKQVKEVQSTAEDANAMIQATQDAVEYNLVSVRSADAETPSEFPEVSPGEDPDDPWAGQFGGQYESNHRRLEASIRLIPGRPRLAHRSVDGAFH